ncbi:MAG: hypothetical protein ABH829_00555 [archaeon]
MAGNETTTEPGPISGALNTIDKLLNVFDNIVAAIVWVNAQFASLGLTQPQIYAILGIIALVAFLFSLRFFEIISKVLIVGLILFVVVSILGIV